MNTANSNENVTKNLGWDIGNILSFAKLTQFPYFITFALLEKEIHSS
jgi:hypothetical protein